MPSNYTYQVWDGVSEINGIPAHVWRKECGMSEGQLAYMLYKNGKMTHFQAWNPFEAGFVEMTAASIEAMAQEHADQEAGKELAYSESVTDDRIINLANSYVLEYGFSGGTGDPSYTHLTINNANPQNADKVRVSFATATEIDAKGILAMTESGNRLQIRGKTNSTAYYVYRVNELPEINESYIEFDVTWLYGADEIAESRVLLNLMPPSTVEGKRRVLHEFSHSVPQNGALASVVTMPTSHPARRWKEMNHWPANSQWMMHKDSQTNSPEVVWVNYSGQIWQGNLETGECVMLHDMLYNINAGGICSALAHDGKIYFVMTTHASTLFVFDEATKQLSFIKTPLAFNHIYGVVNGSVILGNNTGNTQIYVYGIATGLFSLLATKPADFRWDNAAMHVYNDRLYVMQFGTVKQSWYYDFGNDSWQEIVIPSMQQLAHNGDSAVDYDTGDFYVWRAAIVEKVNLNTLVYTKIGSTDFPSTNYAGLFYKNRLMTWQYMLTVGETAYETNKYFPWSGMAASYYQHISEDDYYYYNTSQVYQFNWVKGVIKVLWSVGRATTASYSEKGSPQRCLALAARDGKLYFGGQYPFMLDIATKTSYPITINGVAIAGPTVGTSSFAARFGDDVLLFGCGVVGENTAFNRIVKVKPDGTGEYMPVNWVFNTSTDAKTQLIVLEEDGLVFMNDNSRPALNMYNPFVSTSVVRSQTFNVALTSNPYVTFYNKRSKAWYSITASEFYLEPASVLLLTAGFAVPTLTSIVMNADRGFAVAFTENLIYNFPETICVQKVGRINKGQVLDFSVGGGMGLSHVMINKKRYAPGRYIVQEDGDVWSVLMPDGNAAKWLNGWIEEA